MSEAGTRTINAYAAKAPGAPLEPYTFEAPALPATGVEVKVTHCGLCGSDVHLWRADGDYKDFTGWAAGQKVQICGHEAVGEVTAVAIFLHGLDGSASEWAHSANCEIVGR